MAEALRVEKAPLAAATVQPQTRRRVFTRGPLVKLGNHSETNTLTLNISTQITARVRRAPYFASPELLRPQSSE